MRERDRYTASKILVVKPSGWPIKKNISMPQRLDVTFIEFEISPEL